MLNEELHKSSSFLSLSIAIKDKLHKERLPEQSVLNSCQFSQTGQRNPFPEPQIATCPKKHSCLYGLFSSSLGGAACPQPSHFLRSTLQMSSDLVKNI